MPPTQTLVEEPTMALQGTPTWDGLDVPVVKTPKDEQFVTDYMNMAKGFQTKVKEFFKPHKDRAYAAWKGLCNSENDTLAAAVETEAACKKALAEYKAERDRLAEQEHQRLLEIARKQDEERRVQEAAALEAAANATTNVQEAEELREEAKVTLEEKTTTVVQRPVAPKATGVVYKDKYKGVLLDIAKDKPKLIITVGKLLETGARPELAALFDLNEATANKLAEMLKKHECEILPGLTCVRHTEVGGRRR